MVWPPKPDREQNGCDWRCIIQKCPKDFALFSTGTGITDNCEYCIKILKMVNSHPMQQN